MDNTTESPDVRADVRGFLARYVDDPEQLADDTALISSGMVESMVAVQLIDLLQRLYGVKVQDDDLELENFDSIGGLDRFVQRKLGGSPSA